MRNINDNSKNIPTQSKRRILTIGEKLEILQLLYQKETHRKVAAKFNVGRSTVTKIWKKRDSPELCKIGKACWFKKRYRQSTFNELEIRLVKWLFKDIEKETKDIINGNQNKSNFQNFNRFNDEIYSDVLIEKANEIAKELRLDNFVGSSQWLTSIKRKYGLNLIMKRKKGIIESEKIKLSSENTLESIERDYIDIRSTNSTIQTLILPSNVPEGYLLPLQSITQKYQNFEANFFNNDQPLDPSTYISYNPVYNYSSNNIMPLSTLNHNIIQNSSNFLSTFSPHSYTSN